MSGMAWVFLILSVLMYGCLLHEVLIEDTFSTRDLLIYATGWGACLMITFFEVGGVI